MEAGCLVTLLTQISVRVQLVYNAIAAGRPGIKDAVDIRVPVPAILKPQPLWTGKQVCTPRRCTLRLMGRLYSESVPC